MMIVTLHDMRLVSETHYLLCPKGAEHRPTPQRNSTGLFVTFTPYTTPDGQNQKDPYASTNTISTSRKLSAKELRKSQDFRVDGLGDHVDLRWKTTTTSHQSIPPRMGARLVGFVVHDGTSLNAGHYAAYVRGAQQPDQQGAGGQGERERVQAAGEAEHSDSREVLEIKKMFKEGAAAANPDNLIRKSSPQTGEIMDLLEWTWSSPGLVSERDLIPRNRWYHADDDKVRRVNEEEVKTKLPYGVLFYYQFLSLQKTQCHC